MKVHEFVSVFQKMVASDRLYLLCKMLQNSLTYELNFVSIVLSSYLKERLADVSDLQENANTVSYYSTIVQPDTSIVSKQSLETLSACLAMVRPENQQVGKEVYKLLDQRSILSSAEEIEDFSLFENLRLVYIMAVYHPSLSFNDRHRLLTVYLHQLEEIYNSKVAERNTREAEEREELNWHSRPADSAHIIKCGLIGFYKRQTDRRYAYVIEVKWSDGASCNVQRTYGDFFGFQNKLLDLFPDESGQKNKKSRVIPFLPGRRLLSGKSNRELAEKRLPDLFNYTKDLFLLPEHISTSKYVQDFFRPHLSDQRDVTTYHKLTTLSDIKESVNKSRHPSAPPTIVFGTSPSNSPKTRFQTGLLSTLTNSRNAQTLPSEKSPGPQRDVKMNKHSTLPTQSAFMPFSGADTPSSSNEKLHSSSQTSLGSIDRLLTTPTTTPCRVVTPPTTRSNGSPAFSVSHTHTLASSSWSNMLNSSAKVEVKSKDTLKNTTKDSSKDSAINDTVKKSNVTKSSTLTPPTKTTVTVSTATVQTSDWAECTSPVATDTEFYFTAHESSKKAPPTTTTPNSSIFRPIQSKKDGLSPSVNQIYYGGGSSQPTYLSYPISYTPTNFDSPSPSPKHSAMGGRWQSSYGPLCSTPSNQNFSEAEMCKKWLKAHRLHKYENLFTEMSFDKMSGLTVEQLKEMGMTLGAAKKLYQKMEELKQTCVQSFRDIPHSSLTRKPSTSSLPAALILQERQGLTPSSSIDQLSLHGSSCSLDILGQAVVGGAVHDGVITVEGGGTVISRVDGAILEAGPVNGNHVKGGLGDSAHKKPVSRNHSEAIIRSRSSHGNTNNSNSYVNHTPSRSVDHTPNHSPLKIQRSLSPHHMSHSHTVYQNQSESIRDRIQSVPEKSPNCSSLPVQTGTSPHSNRKDIHSLPSNIGIEGGGEPYHHHHHAPPKIPQVLVPTGRIPNWSMTPPTVLHGSGPIVVPNSGPIVRGRGQPTMALPPGYQATINGLVQSHVSLHRVPSYPMTGPHSVGGVAIPTPSCYNCGRLGHHGMSCNSTSPIGDYHFAYAPQTPPIANNSSPHHSSKPAAKN